MIEINLLPRELCLKQGTDWKKVSSLAFCLTVLVMAIGIWAAQSWQINQCRQQIREIEGNLASLGDLTKDFAHWEEEKKKIQLNRQWQESLQQEKIQINSFLQQVAEAVPQEAWLTKLSIQGQSGIIEGKGRSYQSLVTFLNNLKASSCFQGEPNLTNSQTVVTPGTTPLVSFEIRGQLAGGIQ